MPEHAEKTQSFLAQEIARWVDEMSEADRHRAFAIVYQMSKGNWPHYSDGEPDAAGAEHKPD